MAETILITGTNRGIGLALSRVFADKGWRVIACCRQPEQADALAAIRPKGEGEVSLHRLDVTDDEQIESLRHELHGVPIDILLNNAGVSGPEEQGFGFLDEAGWLETFRVNAIAPYKLAKALLDNVRLGRRRVIASMGSIMGSLEDNNGGGYYVYRTAKAGVHMVMKNLSVDLRSVGIIAVALHPGWVRTDMGGSEAPLSPEQSAEGLFQTLLSLEPGQSGSFLDYLGASLSW